MKFHSTPWGQPQHVRELAEGIYSVSTAGHGGIYVADELLGHIPAAWREWSRPWSGSKNWFEEDCAAYAVVLAFPDLFNERAYQGGLREAARLGLPVPPAARPAKQLALI